METKTVTVLRGRGSGRSTWVRDNAPDAVVISASHHMVDSDGRYFFDPGKLTEYQAESQVDFVLALMAGKPKVVVDNEATTHAELIFYQGVALAFEYRLEVLDIYDGGLQDEDLAMGNVPRAPLGTVQAMRDRYQESPTAGAVRAAEHIGDER